MGARYLLTGTGSPWHGPLTADGRVIRLARDIAGGSITREALAAAERRAGHRLDPAPSNPREQSGA